ncbi:MAG TPA: response regulator transcription factor [Azospirillum sp.]|nr:response regulator transcription factor [Azospirillum sp.]
MLRVLIAEDHPLFREALAHVIWLVDPSAECTDAATLEQALALINRDEGFDLIMLDLGLPGTSGLSAALTVREQATTTPVIIVSAWEDAHAIRQAIRLGVSGYMPKSLSREAMVSAVDKVLSGGTYFPVFEEMDTPADPGAATDSLTPRQLTVLQLLGEGQSNKQIAYELSISQETVKIHISAILRKLGVTSRSKAMLIANRLTGTKVGAPRL